MKTNSKSKSKAQPTAKSKSQSKSQLKKYSIGAPVQWKWLGGLIDGHIREVHFEPITKTLKGKNIKRNGSKENPAYLVQSEAGNFALKLQTELIVK